MKNLIKILGLTIVLGMSLNASTDYKVATLQYEKNVSYEYVKLKSLTGNADEWNRILPCSNIPKKIYVADKFFANLKDFQIIVCDDFIYRADKKAWFIKK